MTIVKSFFKKILDSMVRSRQSQVNQYLQMHGYRSIDFDIIEEEKGA